MLRLLLPPLLLLTTIVVVVVVMQELHRGSSKEDQERVVVVAPDKDQEGDGQQWRAVVNIHHRLSQGDRLSLDVVGREKIVLHRDREK